MNKEIEALKIQIAELTKRLDAYENSQTIPLAFQRAFTKRVGSLTLTTSAHSGETQTVNEGGGSSYSVMKPADGFDERLDNGVTKYYPYFT